MHMAVHHKRLQFSPCIPHMILAEKRNRIMTEHHISVLICNLRIGSDPTESVEIDSISVQPASVVIPTDQVNFPPQLRKNPVDGWNVCAFPGKHIPEHKYLIPLLYLFVPAIDHTVVHFLHGSERSSIHLFHHTAVKKVHIRNIISHASSRSTFSQKYHYLFIYSKFMCYYIFFCVII